MNVQGQALLTSGIPLITVKEILTLRAESSQSLFGGGHVCQTQSAIIKVLIGEEMGKANSRGIVCDVVTELLKRSEIKMRKCLQICDSGLMIKILTRIKLALKNETFRS